MCVCVGGGGGAPKSQINKMVSLTSVSVPRSGLIVASQPIIIFLSNLWS